MNTEEKLVIIGRRVREKREAMGYSKTKFATKIGTSRPQLERIELGLVNSTIGKLYQISEALKIEICELVTI